MESFPAFSGRTESRDLICIRHTYQNDKICKPIGLLKSYENRIKALENRPPPEFLGEKLTGPCLNLLERDLLRRINDCSKGNGTPAGVSE